MTASTATLTLRCLSVRQTGTLARLSWRAWPNVLACRWFGRSWPMIARQGYSQSGSCSDAQRPEDSPIEEPLCPLAALGCGLPLLHVAE